MKKAFAWLAAHDIPHTFVDYRRTAPSSEQLADWQRRVGWQVLLNKQGTTWRKLAEDERAELDTDKALALLARYPTLIKRPVIDSGRALLVGYDAERYAREFIGADA